MIDELKLNTTSDARAAKVGADSPVEIHLIDINLVDTGAARSAKIANAVGPNTSHLVTSQLENPAGGLRARRRQEHQGRKFRGDGCQAPRHPKISRTHIRPVTAEVLNYGSRGHRLDTNGADTARVRLLLRGSSR